MSESLSQQVAALEAREEALRNRCQALTDRLAATTESRDAAFRERNQLRSELITAENRIQVEGAATRKRQAMLTEIAAAVGEELNPLGTLVERLKSRLAAARGKGAREFASAFKAWGNFDTPMEEAIDRFVGQYPATREEPTRGELVCKSCGEKYAVHPAGHSVCPCRPTPPAAPSPERVTNVSWSDAGYNREVLSDSTGLILGSIVTHRHTTTACGPKGVIGDFISVNLAKQAVVAALASGEG